MSMKKGFRSRFNKTNS